MSSIRCLRVALALTTIAGCAHDLTVAYPAPHPGGGGAVDVLLNHPSSAMSITVNDMLVVDREHSRKARIERIPPGPAHIRIATGGKCEQGRESDHDVEIIPGQTVSLTLAGPEPNTGCMIYAGLSYVGVQIALVGLAVVSVVAASSSGVMRGK